MLAIVGALLGLAWFVAVERGPIADAIGLLAHADAGWIAVGTVTSIVSIVLFAAVRTVLLGSGGVHLGLVRATTASFASGAIAATLPAGGAIATAYMVQRYREAGADGGLAGWTTIATGVVAPSVLVFITLSGYAVAGDRPSEVILPAIVALALLGGFFALSSNPSVMRRPAAVAVGIWLRVRSSPNGATDPTQRRRERGRESDAVAARFVESFGAVRAGPPRWAATWFLQLLSWVGELVSLFAAIAAVGGQLPIDAAGWGSLLAVYGTSQLAGALPIIPGGAGQVEAAIVIGLTATGTDAATALAASVAFRLMSHWLVVPIGWVCVAVLRRKGIGIPGRATVTADRPLSAAEDAVEHLEPGG